MKFRSINEAKNLLTFQIFMYKLLNIIGYSRIHRYVKKNILLCWAARRIEPEPVTFRPGVLTED